jgi:hypothetical protein
MISLRMVRRKSCRDNIYGCRRSSLDATDCLQRS